MEMLNVKSGDAVYGSQTTFRTINTPQTIHYFSGRQPDGHNKGTRHNNTNITLAAPKVQRERSVGRYAVVQPKSVIEGADLARQKRSKDKRCFDVAVPRWYRQTRVMM